MRATAYRPSYRSAPPKHSAFRTAAAAAAGPKVGAEGWLEWLKALRLGLRRAVGFDFRGRRYFALGRQAGCFRIWVEGDEGLHWGWYEGAQRKGVLFLE